jgi:hypothetical protein
MQKAHFSLKKGVLHAAKDILFLTKDVRGGTAKRVLTAEARSGTGKNRQD